MNHIFYLTVYKESLNIKIGKIVSDKVYALYWGNDTSFKVQAEIFLSKNKIPIYNGIFFKKNWTKVSYH
jgi:hypothetical protein